MSDRSSCDLFTEVLAIAWRVYPSLTTFDAGSGEVCQIRRIRTKTPRQALVTLNDPVYIEAAAAFANRMTSGDTDDFSRTRRGLRLALVDLFDDKPELKRLHMQDAPPSFLEGKRFAFIKGVPTCTGAVVCSHRDTSFGKTVAGFLGDLWTG
jgi:hypothetical protein